MRRGKDFEVTKDVYERAKANRGYMDSDDRPKYFDGSILNGYGLYDCKVREENGKYICSWWCGSSCD